jgi:hypothetical protein
MVHAVQDGGKKLTKNPSHPSSYEDGDAQTSIYNIKQLLQTSILSSEGSRSPFFRASVTQLLIELSDLLQKASKKNMRISFSDEEDGKARDVTDLINDCRNAVCHISSGKHIFQQNKFAFNVMIGHCPMGMQIGDHTLGCDYPDDIAVYWGGMRLYLRRHYLRAFEEVCAVFPDPWSLG